MKFPQLIEKAGEKIKQQKYGKLLRFQKFRMKIWFTLVDMNTNQWKVSLRSKGRWSRECKK